LRKEQSFYFPLDRKPGFISFDHQNNYLKTVSLEYNLAELKAGLQHNPDPLARIQAAEAIAKKGSLEAVKALEQALLAIDSGGCGSKLPRLCLKSI
jgi:aminopeptidase N